MNEPVVDSNGTKRWYKDDLFHRLDGPAVEYTNGTKVWYKEGKLHRLNGPAVENSNGIKYWHYEGKKLKVSSQEEFIRLMDLKLFW